MVSTKISDSRHLLSRIPNHWKWTTIAELAAKEPYAITDGPFGSKLKTAHYTTSGPRVIRLQNVGDGVFVDVRAHISEEHFASLQKHRALAGDLVIAALGENPPRSCIVPDWLGPAIVKADCIRLKMAPYVSAKFVNFALNSEDTRRRTKKIVHGVGRPRLNLSEIKSITVPLPPLDEQHRIVAEIEKQFTRLDAGMGSLERVQTELKRYRASVLKAACEGSLVPTKANMWRTMTIEDISSTIYRYPTFYGIEHLQKGVPVIRGEHIQAGGRISHDWSNYWFVSKEVSGRFPRTILEAGDLVMSVRGSVGKIGIVDHELSGAQVSPNCLRIAPRKNIVAAKWMFIYLTSGVGVASVKEQINQTTIETIKASVFKKTQMPIPPIADQQRIVTEVERRLSVIDELEMLGAANLKRASRLRQSILQQAFDGSL